MLAAAPEPLSPPLDAGTESSPLAPKIIGASESGPLYLQPLDAPGNPYAGKYSELDAWVYANATLMSDEEYIAQYGPGPEARVLASTRPEGWVLEVGYADEQGFMLPMAEQYRRRQQVFSRERPADSILFRMTPDLPDRIFAGLHKFYSAGVLAPQLAQLQKELWSQIDPASYPTIPAWLGENPPLRTIFVPNGEILCIGPLGLRYTEDETPRFYENQGLLTYRYSGEGQLLGTYDFARPEAADWLLIYWPEMNSELGKYQGTGLGRHFGFGFVSIIKDESDPLMLGVVPPDQSKRNILASFDYDGTPIDPFQPTPRMAQHYGTALQSSTVARAYQGQLESGLTSRDSQSPFAGKPNGPVLTDSAPRPRPLIAGDRYSGRSLSLEECTVHDGRSKRWVLVLPLDDPSNPWRSKYGPWDRWLLDQQGQSNPAVTAALEKQRRQQSELRARLATEKREASADEQRVLSDYGVRMDLSDPWQRFELQVSPEGYVIPYAISSVAELLEDASRELLGSQRGEQDRAYSFSLSAGGLMPADMQALLYEAQQDQLEAKGLAFPRVPAWLMEQPVERAAFAPNGDVITYGPLGSYNPDLTLEYGNQRRTESFDEQYHRYGPDGQELAALPSATPACALYNLALLQRFSDLEASGMHWNSFAGVTLVRDAQSREVTEAYDWDGTPLPLDQPRCGHPLAMRWWDYNELLRMYEAQGPD
ncbi:hypothetical protein IT575_00865 [bacterium]|nr:hypothetical protein [bacterium]